MIPILLSVIKRQRVPLCSVSSVCARTLSCTAPLCSGGSSDNDRNGDSDGDKNVTEDLVKELKKEEDYPASLQRRKRTGLAVEGRVRQLIRDSRKSKKNLAPIGEEISAIVDHANEVEQSVDNSAEKSSDPLKNTADERNDGPATGVVADLLKELNAEESYPPVFSSGQSVIDDRLRVALSRRRKKRDKERATVERSSDTLTEDAAEIDCSVEDQHVELSNPLPEVSDLTEADLPDDGRGVTGLIKSLIPESRDQGKADSAEQASSVQSLFKSSVPLKQRRPQREASSKPRAGIRVNLTDGPTLSLFDGMNYEGASNVEAPEFVSMHEKQWLNDMMALIPSKEPQNAFEEIMLTMDKQWKFPIDNEHGAIEDDHVTFEEHVFLDHMLDEFAENESVQKFMELVITGLQQNPYLTVAQKRERIMWYKDYFEKFPEEELMSVSS